MLQCLAAAVNLAISTTHCVASIDSLSGRVQAGTPFAVVVRLKPDTGWHTYWENPGDSGMATSITWTLPDGWKASSIEWPAPELEEGPSGTNYIYPKEVSLRVWLTPPPTFHSQVTLKAKVDWLVCKEACLPGQADLSLTVKPGPVPSHGQVIDASNFPVPPKFSIAARRTGSELLLIFGTKDVPANVAFYSADGSVDPHIPAQTVSEAGKQGRRLRLSSYAPSKLGRLRGILVVPSGQSLSGGARVVQVDIPIDSGDSR